MRDLREQVYERQLGILKAKSNLDDTTLEYIFETWKMMKELHESNVKNKELNSLIDELKEDIFNEDIGGAVKTLRHYGITN